MTKKTICGQYYGTPVYLRFEHYDKSTAVIYSYRSPDGRILYAHPHRVVSKEMRAILKAAPPGALSDEMFSKLETVCDEQLREFFRCMLSPDTDKEPDPNKKKALHDEGLRRRRELADLSFGALVGADYERLMDSEDGSKRSLFSLEEDMRVIRHLLEKEGRTLWRNVTPDRCGAWLIGDSRHRRVAVKRLMKKLLLPLYEADILDDVLGWDRYDPAGSEHPRKSHESGVRENLSPTMLTYEQCRALLPQPDGDGLYHPAPFDIALLLMTSLGLDAETVCGLEREDFTPLKDFPRRLCIDITKKYVHEKGHANCRTVEISDVHQRRKLPLSDYAAACVNALFQNSGRQTGPLLSHATNPHRKMDPQQLRKDVEARVSEVRFPPDPAFSDIKKGTSARTLLENTAFRELSKAGAEEEEIRYLRGLPGRLVSARHYVDFMNESELNRLGALQDRWLKRVIPALPPVPLAQNVPFKRKMSCASGTAETRTSATVEIEFPPGTDWEEDLEIGIFALNGFDCTAAFKEEQCL